MTGQPVRLGGTNSAGCWDVRSVEHTLHGLGESFGCGYFRTTANHVWNERVRLSDTSVVRAQKAGYENIPGLRSVAARGLRQLGLMSQGSLRQPL